MTYVEGFELGISIIHRLRLNVYGLLKNITMT